MTFPRVRVNLYASATGDTTGRQLPTVTLIAAAYDETGTRYVRRLDLRRESFSRYGYFVDSFPSGATIGPATKTEVEIGLNSKTLKAGGKIQALPPGGMCQFRARITSAAEVDRALLAALRQAYDEAG